MKYLVLKIKDIEFTKVVFKSPSGLPGVSGIYDGHLCYPNLFVTFYTHEEIRAVCQELKLEFNDFP